MADNQFPEDEGKTRRRPRGSSAATPTAAEARAAQARAGQYVNSRDLLMDRGQAEYDRAVNRNATSMPEPPGGRRTGYGSPSMPEPPGGRMPTPGAATAGTGSALRSGAGAVLRGAARIPGVDSVANATPAARAQLTDSAEGRRMVAENEARRASDAAAGAAENYGGAGSTGPSADNAINVEVAARRPRPNTRPTTRMSPRSMSSDDLNEISLAAAQRRGGAEMELNRPGDIARRIMAREGEQDRQRELEGMKRGGPVKKMAKGGVVKSSASGRSDGCAVKGKTKGRMV